MVSLSLITGFFVLFAVAAARPTDTWAVGDEVVTTSGIYKGHASSIRPEVSEYLGIRYGQETSGARRFAKPVPFKSNEKLTADKFSLDCPTMLSANVTGFMSAIASAAQATNPAGEDCLSLNIWTKPQAGEKKKAVMVWVYGGGFNVGTAHDKQFDGSLYADEEDVVLVTLNYRLVTFGFPGGVEGVDSNVGLRDQRLATEWVRDNIERFGGDPNRIIIFGQSAGAFSVDNYAYAWAGEKDPIIKGIIAQSGSAYGRGMVRSGGNSAAWQSMAKVLGCAIEGKASLDCVRGKPWLDVLNAMRGGPGLANGAMSSFGPTVDNEVVFPDNALQATEGKFIKVPVLIGMNDDEAGIGSLLSIFGGKQAQAGMEVGINCPPARAIEARTKQNLPAWRFRSMAAYPNTGTAATHGSELALVFGTMDTGRPNQPKSSEDELKLSKTIRTAWAAFAKDPKEGLSKLGWPVYQAGKPTLVLLGENNKPETKFVDPAKYDSACDAYWKAGSTSSPPKTSGTA